MDSSDKGFETKFKITNQTIPPQLYKNSQIAYIFHRFTGGKIDWLVQYKRQTTQKMHEK